MVWTRGPYRTVQAVAGASSLDELVSFLRPIAGTKELIIFCMM